MTETYEGDELEVEERFSSVPEWLLRHPDVSNAAVRLYAIIQRFGNESGHRMPGRAELADWMHCSADTVDRAKSNLELIGAVRIKRSKPIKRGESGVVRAPNRYVLRVTNPAIGHVIPPTPPSRRFAATGRTDAATPPSRTDAALPKQELQTTTGQARDPRTFKQVVVAITDQDKHTLGDLLELAAELRTIRRHVDGAPIGDRRWSDFHVARAIVEALDAGHQPELIRGALLELARDQATRHPYRLKYDGPWWAAASFAARREAKATSYDDRLAAIAACPRCDDFGWLTTDTGEIHCDHQLGDISGTA